MLLLRAISQLNAVGSSILPLGDLLEHKSGVVARRKSTCTNPQESTTTTTAQIVLRQRNLHVSS